MSVRAEMSDVSPVAGNCSRAGPATGCCRIGRGLGCEDSQGSWGCSTPELVSSLPEADVENPGFWLKPGLGSVGQGVMALRAARSGYCCPVPEQGELTPAQYPCGCAPPVGRCPPAPLPVYMVTLRNQKRASNKARRPRWFGSGFVSAATPRRRRSASPLRCTPRCRRPVRRPP